MNWIFDNFQIVFLVLLAFASWIKTRVDAKNAEREAEAEELEPYEPEEEWQQQPQDPAGPPPLVRPPTPPPLPMAAFESAREAAATLKHQQDLAERLRQIRETRATTSGGAAATRVRVAESRQPSKTAVAVPVNLRARLKSRKELKRAVVMREILDPPVGLR
jgi:type IV secretory pathway VirB10-like protein